MVKRKLKGENAKKIPAKKKTLMQKVLGRMDKTREKDNAQLRELLNGKLEWAIAEIKKGKILIADYQQKIHKTTIQVYKLDGVITAIREILNPQEENADNKKRL